MMKWLGWSVKASAILGIGIWGGVALLLYNVSVATGDPFTTVLILGPLTIPISAYFTYLILINPVVWWLLKVIGVYVGSYLVAFLFAEAASRFLFIEPAPPYIHKMDGFVAVYMGTLIVLIFLYHTSREGCQTIGHEKT